MPPALPDGLVAEDLDIGARAQLKTLTKDNAEYVAKHMAMASQLIDDNPELAHQHALTAARRAGRIGVVRETLAITAYQLGDFALALRELRTYRRITGRDDQLPLMADCERGLGRPEKALELARSVDASTLDTAVRVELAIVKSGARLDLGQKDEALEELRIPELRKDKAFEYSPALFASFAGVLEELGRDDEAAEWFALADRAVDALEAAMAPGELESIGITTERLETEHELPEDGVELEGSAGSVVEREDVPETADAVEPTGEQPVVGHEDVPASNAISDADTESDAAQDVVDSGDVPDVETAAPADADPAVIATDDVPAAAATHAAAADEIVVETQDVPDATPAASDEAPAAPSDEPAPHGDALFGDALFGDELIEQPGEDGAGEDGAGEAQRDGDAR
ncbi:MAG TPA: hypothetical protein VFM87_01675 [Agrococcus sp.]|nr:hypothetical protein [Agrococcus sp.]